MLLPEDWREFIKLLNSHGVEYLIVGAVALAHHGLPRYTGDLDILVHNTAQNAQRLESVLNEFGFTALGLKAGDFLEADHVIQLGVAPDRIDILTSITGVSFEKAWAERVQAEMEGLGVNFIGRQTLVQNKRLTGRTQDKADLEALGEVAE
jgi:predicted Zn-dependent protease with MMP-like domain